MSTTSPMGINGSTYEPTTPSALRTVHTDRPARPSTLGDQATTDNEAAPVAASSSPGPLIPLHLPLGDGDKAQLTADQTSASLLVLRPVLQTPGLDPATITKAGKAYADKTAPSGQSRKESPDKHKDEKSETHSAKR